MGRILFKYLAPSRASVLSDGLIRFSQVSALNDPFESTAAISTAAMAQQLIDEADSELDKVISEWGDQLSEADRKLVKIERERLHYQIRASITPGRFGREIMNLANSSIGVLSLSQTENSVLMWSHYAQDHTGFLIGLDEDSYFFREKDGRGEETEIQDVMYEEKRVPVDVEDPGWYRALLCQKSIAWAYEKETRVFRVLTPDSLASVDAKGRPVHLFCLPKEAIKKVIFGANSSHTLRAKIQRLIQDRGIAAEVWQAAISHITFDIVFHRLDLPYACYGAGWDTVEYKFPQCADVLDFQLEPIIYKRDLYFSSYRFPSPNVSAILYADNSELGHYSFQL